MDLVALARIALRRWKILVPLLVLSLGIGWLAATAVAPTYQVDGAVRVSYPFSTNSEVGTLIQGNPYYDTESTAIVLSRVGGSVDLADAVLAAGGSATFVIDGSAGRAILTITVTGPDEQEALKTYGIIVRQLSDRLDRLQADKNIPQAYRVTADDVVNPRNATISNSSRTKVLLASLALGVILSVTVSLVADSRMRRTASRSDDPGVESDLLGHVGETAQRNGAVFGAAPDPGGSPPGAAGSAALPSVTSPAVQVRQVPARPGPTVQPSSSGGSDDDSATVKLTTPYVGTPDADGGATARPLLPELDPTKDVVAAAVSSNGRGPTDSALLRPRPQPRPRPRRKPMSDDPPPPDS